MNEPSPRPSVPSGRAAPSLMRSWVQRHNLLVARDGGALPDLTIMRDGGDILVRWEADPVSLPAGRIRFVGHGASRVRAEDFESSARSFVEAVLARLEDRLPDNEDVARLIEGWHAIRSSDAAEGELCRALAVMGVDPYDADEATPALVETVERGIRVLSGELRADLFEGSDPEHLENNLNWIEQARVGLRGVNGRVEFPTIGDVAAPTAQEIGYLAARRVRSELLGVSMEDPIRDLSSALVDRLGWVSGCSRAGPGNAHLDGMIGLDDASSAPLLVAADRRSQSAERFRLARAAFFPVTKSLGEYARLLSRSATRPQRAARAFAAELLAPAEALAKRVSGRLNDQDVERLAEEFSVSSQVIGHQIENHDLGYLETWDVSSSAA